MALPATTDWDITYDEYGVHSGESIKTSVPTKVLQNMDYSLRRDRLLASYAFYPVSTTSGSYTSLFDAECTGPNVLNTVVSANISAVVKAWASDASTGYSLRVYDAAYGSRTLTVAAGAAAATKIWRWLAGGTFTAPGDETIWGFTVDVKRDSGSGLVYIAGVGLFYPSA